MLDFDTTFVLVSQRHEDLRRLAGSDPMIPVPNPPSDSVRRLVLNLRAKLAAWQGKIQPSGTISDPKAIEP